MPKSEVLPKTLMRLIHALDTYNQRYTTNPKRLIQFYSDTYNKVTIRVAVKSNIFVADFRWPQKTLSRVSSQLAKTPWCAPTNLSCWQRRTHNAPDQAPKQPHAWVSTRNFTTLKNSLKIKTLFKHAMDPRLITQKIAQMAFILHVLPVLIPFAEILLTRILMTCKNKP